MIKEVNVHSDASSADDVWSALNGGQDWSDFEAAEDNWWDEEEEIDWDTDVLSGEKIETEKIDAKRIKVVDLNQPSEIHVSYKLGKEKLSTPTLEKPKTGDAELDKMLKEFKIKKDGTEARVDFKETGRLVSKVNEALKKDLLDGPTTKNVVSFMDKISTYAMRSVPQEKYEDLGFDEDFKEIVRFSELTANEKKYNEAEFEDFWQGFLTDFSWSDTPNYQRVVMHVLGNVAGLAKKYKDEGKSDSMVDSLWSGNLVHELIGLADVR